MSITITVPNDDHVALRAMAKALEEIAAARGAPSKSKQIGELKYTLNIDTTQATAALAELVKQAEVDTTSQQVESLSHGVVNREVYFDNPAPQVSNATTDSTGTPWDERIHSASKALNADGSWRLRRKPKDMDEAEWNEYVEEVKSLIKSDESHREKNEQILEEEYPSVVYAPEPSVTPAGDDFHVDTGEVTEQEVVAIPVPPLPVPPVQQSTMSFPDVMKFLTERHARISNEQVTEIITAMGLKSIMDLNTQPEHTGPFIARVKALLGE